MNIVIYGIWNKNLGSFDNKEKEEKRKKKEKSYGNKAT
jgi:hypothetical protein